MEHCDHDYEGAIRKAPFYYICPKCGADITLGVMLLEECLRELKQSEYSRL
jgi:hypothetical protein